MAAKTKRIDGYFWGGIVVGVVVMFAGTLALMWRGVGTNEARLILCTGIGILFGAFGSTATINYKGVTITGVAAITIVLLYLIVHFTASQATFGAITGDIRGAQIDVRGDEVYLGAMRDRSYDFVVDEGELKRPVFDVYIYFPPDDRGRGEQEIPLEGIDTKYIEPFLGSGQRLEWRFYRDQELLVETVSGDTMARMALSLDDLPFSENTGSGERESGSWLVKKAFAKEPPQDVNKALEDLRSGSPDVRRDARSQLATMGPLAVNDMMAAWRANPEVYRVQLGVLVSLTKILRDDKSQAPQVSERLTTADLQLILNALDSSDRTVRIYAGEFLYDLGDPRALEPALQMATRPETSEEGVYLSLFVVKGAYPRLPQDEQANVNRRLQALRERVGPNTQALIDSIRG